MTRKRNPKDTNATEPFQIFGWHLSGLRLVILGAIGGVILTVAGNVATAAYSEWRTSINEQLAAARQAGKDYEALGDVPRRAGEFISTQNDGSADDVRSVARLLRSMMMDMSNNRYTADQFQSAIGGRAKYWQHAFDILANHKSPVANEFSEGERELFKSLTKDLEIASQPEADDVGTASMENAAAAQDRRQLPAYR